MNYVQVLVDKREFGGHKVHLGFPREVRGVTLVFWGSSVELSSVPEDFRVHGR